jgi:hypothetical protein
MGAGCPPRAEASDIHHRTECHVSRVCVARRQVHVLNLIEADLELDRVRGLGHDEMSADQRRDLLDTQDWKRTDALVALTRKP